MEKYILYLKINKIFWVEHLDTYKDNNLMVNI